MNIIVSSLHYRVYTASYGRSGEKAAQVPGLVLMNEEVITDTTFVHT